MDEIHAVVDDRRGAHLALSVERLAALTKSASGGPLQRVGLSATQKPVEKVACFLVGTHAVDAAGNPDCRPHPLHACRDRKSTRLNSSHLGSSYAVLCL